MLPGFSCCLPYIPVGVLQEPPTMNHRPKNSKKSCYPWPKDWEKADLATEHFLTITILLHLTTSGKAAPAHSCGFSRTEQELSFSTLSTLSTPCTSSTSLKQAVLMVPSEEVTLHFSLAELGGALFPAWIVSASRGEVVFHSLAWWKQSLFSPPGSVSGVQWAADPPPQLSIMEGNEVVVGGAGRHFYSLFPLRGVMVSAGISGWGWLSFLSQPVATTYESTLCFPAPWWHWGPAGNWTLTPTHRSAASQQKNFLLKKED